MYTVPLGAGGGASAGGLTYFAGSSANLALQLSLQKKWTRP